MDSSLWITLALTLPLMALQGGSAAEPDGEPGTPSGSPALGDPPAAAAFELPRLEAELAASEGPYLEFFDSRSLRMGLYALPAGAEDHQPVHDEDEAYHVLEGRATLRVEKELIPVEPGSTVFVRAGAEHRFIDIEEDLKLLVIFGATLPEADR